MRSDTFCCIPPSVVGICREVPRALFDRRCREKCAGGNAGQFSNINGNVYGGGRFVMNRFDIGRAISCRFASLLVAFWIPVGLSSGLSP